MKTPQFHKFYDRSSQSPKALLLDESQLTTYLFYIDSVFTNSNITFENDKVSIRKYVCPQMRYNAILWHTHVFIVATLKSDRKYKHIATYGSVMYKDGEKFDDTKFKAVLKESVFDNWGIQIKKEGA